MIGERVDGWRWAQASGLSVGLHAALLAQGTADVLVILRRDVPVQRLVTVLQTLAAHGITSVQVAGGGI